MVNCSEPSNTVGHSSELDNLDNVLCHNNSQKTVACQPTPQQLRQQPSPLPRQLDLLLRARITAPTLTVPGVKDYGFELTLPGQPPIDLTHLGTGEITVIGPNGYGQVARFTAIRERTICYRVSAPNSIWTQGDNGIYQIHVVTDEVVSPGMMQTFQVEIANDIDGCLVQNGGFENGFNAWVTFTGTEQISKTDAYVGKAALMLSTMESGTSQNVEVRPGTIYQLTGYGRSTCQGYCSFGMTFFDAKDSLLLRSDVGNIHACQWQDYFVIAIAPTNTAYVQVWTYQDSDQGVTQIDGLALRQIDENNLPPTQVSKFSLINAPLAMIDSI
ncbi:MAG: hypothetical protein KTR27_03745 [Leptolyngbyaceae cyanobacterium MAG.088]|nr:hypothetical protein [Leptolyngbyaceae cyanobacterium MAG.088]